MADFEQIALDAKFLLNQKRPHVISMRGLLLGRSLVEEAVYVEAEDRWSGSDRKSVV